MDDEQVGDRRCRHPLATFYAVAVTISRLSEVDSKGVSSMVRGGTLDSTAALYRVDGCRADYGCHSRAVPGRTGATLGLGMRITVK